MIDSSPWVGLGHRGPATVPLEVSPEHRLEIEAAARRPKAEARIARRAQALLLMADGVATGIVARLVGVHERTAFEWRRRFMVENPVAMLADAPRSGRPPSLSRTRTRRGSKPKPAGTPAK